MCGCGVALQAHQFITAAPTLGLWGCPQRMLLWSGVSRGCAGAGSICASCSTFVPRGLFLRLGGILIAVAYLLVMRLVLRR